MILFLYTNSILRICSVSYLLHSSSISFDCFSAKSFLTRKKKLMHYSNSSNSNNSRDQRIELVPSSAEMCAKIFIGSYLWLKMQCSFLLVCLLTHVFHAMPLHNTAILCALMLDNGISIKTNIAVLQSSRNRSKVYCHLC